MNSEEKFPKIQRLPPYVFNIVNELKINLRRAGEDIVDLGMGNPDLPTPKHIVEKLKEAVDNPKNHRYSASRGIYKLRLAIANWYKRKFDVDIDPETEAVVTIGSKEGLAHLVLAIIGPGDVVVVPTPNYPIHTYSVVISGGDVRHVPLEPNRCFIEDLEKTVKDSWPRPKLLIINYPNNPTTKVVDLDFFRRIVDFAKENNIYVIHDFAYAELVFDEYKAPSIFQVPGAKDIAVESYSLSKTYSMPGWRVGFMVGNKDLIHALTRIKSYLDYGMFQPIQIASIIALNGPQDCVQEIVNTYKNRRDVLIRGLKNLGWEVEPPKATMFVWSKIPEPFQEMGSLEFSKLLIKEGKVAVSPGIGFGNNADQYVRFALVENEHRIRQAIRGIRKVFQKHGIARGK